MFQTKKRTKLDDKSEKYVFVGYDSRSKGYKLYNPNSRKIVISRDVEFDVPGGGGTALSGQETLR